MDTPPVVCLVLIIANSDMIVDISVYTKDDSIIVDHDVDTFSKRT